MDLSAWPMNSQTVEFPIPPDIAEQHARMVEVALISGDPAKAHAAVDRAFQSAREQAEIYITNDSYIDELRITSRMVTILNGHGIQTVGQLIQYTAEGLQKMAQLRGYSVGLIQYELGKHGFQLA